MGLLYMYLLIHYRSSKFVENPHLCICVHNKYDLIGLWVQKCHPSVWVFTDFNISIFVLLKKRIFFVGKTSLMFQSRWSLWCLRTSPEWTSHRIYLNRCMSAQVPENFVLCKCDPRKSLVCKTILSKQKQRLHLKSTPIKTLRKQVLNFTTGKWLKTHHFSHEFTIGIQIPDV